MIIDMDDQITQGEFGKLIGESQAAVSKKISDGILTPGGTLRTWLLEACNRWREEAAGRMDAGGNLSVARARESEIKAQLLEVDLDEKLGRLVPVDEIEPRLLAMVVAARTELLIMADKVRHEIQSRYGVEIDPEIIDTHVNNSLAHLATGGGPPSQKRTSRKSS